MPTFDIVSEWYQQHYPEGHRSDTERVGINLNTAQGAFEALILAVLYSTPISPKYAEDTIRALMDNHLTDIPTWLNLANNDETRNTVMQIFDTYYQKGRLKENKTKFIRYNAAWAFVNFHGDMSYVFDICDGDERRMIEYLTDNLKGISRKAFWYMREMRMRGVWDIGGMYCCVPDIQVGKSLQRWGYIDKFKSNLNIYLQCSAIVWNHFQDMYDFPVWHFARMHQCNSRRRNCADCQIEYCRDRAV